MIGILSTSIYDCDLSISLLARSVAIHVHLLCNFASELDQLFAFIISNSLFPRVYARLVSIESGMPDIGHVNPGHISGPKFLV